MMRALFSSPVCGLPRTVRTTLPRRYATASRSNGPASGLAYRKKAQHQENQQQSNPKAFESPAYGPRPVPDDASDPRLFRQSRHYTVAKAHKIEFPSSLRPLKCRFKSNGSQVWGDFSQRHTFHQQDLRSFDIPEHPGAGCVLDRYIDASDGSQPLWWSVTIHGGTSPPFVSTTAQRLLNRAIRLALEEKGYDRYGRRLVPHGVQPPKNNPLDLYGTLRISCTGPKELCQLKFESKILAIGRTIIATALPRLDGSYAGSAYPVRENSAAKRSGPRNKLSWPNRGSNKKGHSQKW